ncbi:MAG: YqgE/AlgH family protein [Alphaproteobacteria bacterium]|nr:YqgE/AlgH family protein [Alphaproteobacteria bacterium]
MDPGILIASPQMRDPNFEGTIVLLCHHDADGALGLVVNRETSITLADVLEQLSMDATDTDTAHPVLWGGPVEQGAGLLIFDGSVDEATGWNLPHDIAVSASREQLQQILSDGMRHVLCLGYAGWGPGQLDQEIETGSWLYTEIDRDLIFEEPVDSRYDRALASLGLTSSLVWMTPINE